VKIKKSRHPCRSGVIAAAQQYPSVPPRFPFRLWPTSSPSGVPRPIFESEVTVDRNSSAKLNAAHGCETTWGSVSLHALPPDSRYGEACAFVKDVQTDTESLITETFQHLQQQKKRWPFGYVCDSWTTPCTLHTFALQTSL
jgi:hypothetical protein